MKNPHLFDRLVRWFACFGDFNQDLTKESILENMYKLQSRLDNTPRFNRHRECNRMLDVTVLVLILAAHHMEKKNYPEAKRVISESRQNLYIFERDVGCSNYSTHRANHGFFSIRKDMSKLESKIEKFVEQSEQQKASSTNILSHSLG